jgi:hypothetical protein
LLFLLSIPLHLSRKSVFNFFISLGGPSQNQASHCEGFSTFRLYSTAATVEVWNPILRKQILHGERCAFKVNQAQFKNDLLVANQVPMQPTVFLNCATIRRNRTRVTCRAPCEKSN